MKPVLQALVLADRVYQDVGGKKIIAGTFSGYKFSKKPPFAEIFRPDGTKQRVMVGGMNKVRHRLRRLSDLWTARPSD